MARRLFTLLVVVILLVASTSAESCLGTPSISGLLAEGTACGGAIPCAKGFACDLTSTCSAVKVGDACVDDLGCPFQSSCNGPEGHKKCVAHAGPGDKCGPSDQLNATCDTDCNAGSCVGYLGDGCKVNADCTTGYCNGGTCKNICGASNYCTKNQYCDASDKCVAYPTSGDCTPNCAQNARCVYTDLTETKSHCVKTYSVASGGFCTYSSECASGLCWRHKCQAKSADACVWDYSWTGCAFGEVCTCSNSYLVEGYGTCKTEKCWDSMYKLYVCLAINCENWSFRSPKYCYNQHCKQEFADYNSCDPANALWTIYYLY